MFDLEHEWHAEICGRLQQRDPSTSAQGRALPSFREVETGFLASIHLYIVNRWSQSSGVAHWGLKSSQKTKACILEDMGGDSHRGVALAGPKK
jgi:hypothetical protein